MLEEDNYLAIKQTVLRSAHGMTFLNSVELYLIKLGLRGVVNEKSPQFITTGSIILDAFNRVFLPLFGQFF